MQQESTMLCTEDVVPPTIKKAWAARKASAASSSASLITDTGWQRLSNGFMELTSRLTHFSPRSSTNSGFPLPLLCPGTSKGTTLLRFKRSNASYTGACICLFLFISSLHNTKKDRQNSPVFHVLFIFLVLYAIPCLFTLISTKNISRAYRWYSYQQIFANPTFYWPFHKWCLILSLLLRQKTYKI